MKKIMLAMMATVGLAFFAKADGTTKYPGSTDFEGEEFEVGNVFPVTDKGSGAEAAAFWANYTDAVGESKIVAGGPSEKSTKYASLDTGDRVLLRQAEAGTPVSFGSIYFDTMVQFTASEGDLAVSTNAEDKLVIWLQSNGADGTEGEDDYVAASTNLMIRAAKLNPIDYHKMGSQDYTVVSATPFEAGKWYRLTVKTYADISGLQGVSCPGFEVYIDGTKVSVTGADLYDGYFASLVDWDSVGAGELTGIGFQGTGAVDDIKMTSDDPIVVDEFTASVTLEQVRLAGNENDIVDAWALEGEDKTGTYAATATVAVGDDAKFVVRMVSAWDVTVTATINGVQVDQANIVKTDGEGNEEGSSVYTITIDGSKYGDGDTAALVITITENGSGDEPEDTTEINADGTGYVADETGSTYTQAQVEAMVTVVAPNADSLSDEAKAAYNAYFTKNATYNTETKKWEVAVTLDTGTLEAEVDDAVEAALEAVVGDADTKAVDIPAGFYYKIEHGATVGLTGEPLTGTSTGSVAMPALGEDAGFFKVSVGTTTFAE